METEWIDPWEIEPLHEARIQAHLDALTESMQEDGWRGRPLLVYLDEGIYRAVTGSHRIAAARLADLEAIECYVMDVPPSASWAEELVAAVMDHERMAAIQESGDEDAIALMWAEVRQT